MKIVDINVVENGYLVENSWGERFVAKNLVEVATLAGEVALGRIEVTNPRQLQIARAAADEGHKIDAIKELRKAFNMDVSLRAAKEMVELLCLRK